MTVTEQNNFGPVFDSLPDLLAILDHKLRIVKVNKAFCRKLDITPESAEGQDICTLGRKYQMWNSAAEEALCGNPALFSGDDTVDCQVESPGLGGHYLCSVSPLEQDTGRHDLYLLAMREISRIKHREAALNQDMRLLEDLLENANDMVQSVDPNGRFIYVNKTWREKLGYSAEDIVDLNLKDILDPECAAKCYTMFADVMQGIDLGRVETTFIAKDGSKIIVEGSCNCRIEDGIPIATRGIFRDITEKKRKERDRQEFEQHMQQLQKLESLGLMAGGIAHDFNNLLMGILGFAELILMRETPDGNIATYVKNIEMAAKRAAKLTNQMLAYSGHGRYKVDYLDISSIVKDSQSLFSATVSRKIQLEYDLEGNLPLVEADIDQVRQMLMNLVTNASEAMGNSSGTISIVTGTINADKDYLTSTYINEELPEGCYVFLRVEDTGPGIEKGDMPRIFDPFFTTKFTGRGLGLAAVLGIARGHRGAVRVDSTLGQGTAITILLPVYEGMERDTRTASHEFLTSGKTGEEKVVLLVEDDQTVRQVAAIMISETGIRVLEAKDGQEGFNFFCRERDRIGLVITDMLMPGINGMELLKKIRETGSDVPVVLSSGYNKEDIVTSIEEKELAGFIHKPYNESQIQQMVRDILKPGDKNS